jgi:hypothetical protein
VPAELHSNRMQWSIRLCVMRCYVSVMWRPGMHRSVHTRPPHKGGYTLVTLPRTVTPHRDSVDGTRDHVTYQKLDTR